MFHDPHLDRTTSGTGLLTNQRYHGGLDKLVTKKSPHQKVSWCRASARVRADLAPDPDLPGNDRLAHATGEHYCVSQH